MQYQKSCMYEPKIEISKVDCNKFLYLLHISKIYVHPVQKKVEIDSNLCQSTKAGLSSKYNWDEIQIHSIITKCMHFLWTINDVTMKNLF